MKPMLDGNGRLVLRDDYRIASLNCGDEDFAIACMRSNLKYGKSQRKEDVNLLNGSKNRVTEREYWAKRKGQAALDKENASLAAKCVRLSALLGRISEKPKHVREWNALKRC